VLRHRALSKRASDVADTGAEDISINSDLIAVLRRVLDRASTASW
jgi:hypothetical protein